MTTSWNLLLLCFLPSYRASEDGMYECGTHGRFEYCIDGIPGCVVGCHCHPGYYFDTETKICEPNTKLTQNYRRQYMAEPTRVQSSMFKAEPTEVITTLTTPDIIDEQLNDITKNADDISDWLYNQFFKTIENQVINKTNDNNQFTRRSGHQIKHNNKSKRRVRKRGKTKHKLKKKGLRRELLRITEDDSLFDSSDDSSHDSSDESYSSDSDTELDSSCENDTDKDHRRRRIIMINKKPKPPLPSFIFLPNMNTPFYPPIGLPPPPALPMYPMIPVPPMLPAPPMPYPVPIPECDDRETTSQTTTSATTNTPSTVTPASQDNDVPSTTLDTEPPSETSLRSRFKGSRKRKKDKFPEYYMNNNNNNDEEDLPITNFKPPREGQQKLMQRLRQRLSQSRIRDPYKKRNRLPVDNYINQLSPPDTPMINNNLDEVAPKSNEFSPDKLDDGTQPENVNFKYLSELIHRMDVNNSQGTPLETYKSHSSIEMFNPQKSLRNRYHELDAPQTPLRRMNKQTNQQLTPRVNEPDDSYYSNLGRQIATLIRTIDADNERQVNIEIEKGNEKSDTVPFFNENEPRTFWERSVRSPIKLFYPFKKKYDYVRNSNELLFNIENKVEIVASTTPTLSLRQIENIVKVMETAQTRIQSNSNDKNIKPSTKTLNINLWPQEVNLQHQPRNLVKNYIKPDALYTNIKKNKNYSNNTKPQKINSELNKIGLHHIQNFAAMLNTRKQENGNRMKNSPYIKGSSSKMYYMKNFTGNTFLHPTFKLNIKESTLRNPENLQQVVHPTFFNFGNIKKYFFDDNNNQNTFQNDDLQFQYSAASKTISKQTNNPLPSAYFHHEINHFDYTSISQPTI